MTNDFSVIQKGKIVHVRVKKLTLNREKKHDQIPNMLSLMPINSPPPSFFFVEKGFIEMISFRLFVTLIVKMRENCVTIVVKL